MSEKTLEKPPPGESDEYARFKELMRKLVAVPKKELREKRRKKTKEQR